MATRESVATKTNLNKRNYIHTPSNAKASLKSRKSTAININNGNNDAESEFAAIEKRIFEGCSTVHPHDLYNGKRLKQSSIYSKVKCTSVKTKNVALQEINDHVNNSNEQKFTKRVTENESSSNYKTESFKPTSRGNVKLTVARVSGRLSKGVSKEKSKGVSKEKSNVSKAKNGASKEKNNGVSGEKSISKFGKNISIISDTKSIDTFAMEKNTVLEKTRKSALEEKSNGLSEKKHASAIDRTRNLKNVSVTTPSASCTITVNPQTKKPVKSADGGNPNKRKSGRNASQSSAKKRSHSSSSCSSTRQVTKHTVKDNPDIRSKRKQETKPNSSSSQAGIKIKTKPVTNKLKTEKKKKASVSKRKAGGANAFSDSELSDWEDVDGGLSNLVALHGTDEVAALGLLNEKKEKESSVVQIEVDAPLLWGMKKKRKTEADWVS